MSNKSHKTKRISIKVADVDIEIAPVVNWLNSYNDVLTLFSCQGGKKSYNSPYVIFYCHDYETLRKILREITISKANISCQVEFFGEVNMLRYFLKFHNTEYLKGFISYLKKRSLL